MNVIFERDGDGKMDDGLKVECSETDRLRFFTDHEAHTLTEDDVTALRDALSEWLGDLMLVIPSTRRHPCDLAEMVADFASAICSRRLDSGEDVTKFYGELVQRLGHS